MIVNPLEGSRVLLIPMEDSHAEALYQCSRSPHIWERLPVKVQSLEQMKEFVAQALEGKKRGDEFPFVVWDKSQGRIVGTTRYLRIAAAHRNLNIGWTWYSEDVWRTSVNTECKYLLLRHAFEQWGAVRVELITTTVHSRSQAAIERLGAVREGVLRQKYNGMDYVVFSMIDKEWPEKKDRLEGMLAGAGRPAT
ncbi:GNAT family N-acetyltransferase [Paenibacillus soyae]|uniref:GNAT family N-acetyltransferase n=1 Tax=Paenibacillus soyae TaxID=2969249 RepID=A0A9X2S9J4_9BACL|nr:GNAT family protein [Paenibacillus soyae]MCR2803618.1 GNAT family N-acetyltransferase [Paenibacillus soyae]